MAAQESQRPILSAANRFHVTSERSTALGGGWGGGGDKSLVVTGLVILFGTEFTSLAAMSKSRKTDRTSRCHVDSFIKDNSSASLIHFPRFFLFGSKWETALIFSIIHPFDGIIRHSISERYGREQVVKSCV
jgi:hypothetical protein